MMTSLDVQNQPLRCDDARHLMSRISHCGMFTSLADSFGPICEINFVKLSGRRKLILKLDHTPDWSIEFFAINTLHCASDLCLRCVVPVGAARVELDRSTSRRIFVYKQRKLISRDDESGKGSKRYRHCLSTPLDL